jgi:hypothetical protein
MEAEDRGKPFTRREKLELLSLAVALSGIAAWIAAPALAWECPSAGAESSALRLGYLLTAALFVFCVIDGRLHLYPDSEWVRAARYEAEKRELEKMLAEAEERMRGADQPDDWGGASEWALD